MSIESIRQYLHKVNYLVGSERKSLLLLLPLFLISSGLDIVGIGLLVVFVSILTNPQNLLNYVSYVDTSNLVFNEDLFILTFSVGLFIVFAVKAVMVIYVNKKILDTCFEFSVKLRSFLMFAYQKMDYSTYLKRNSSEYIYNIQYMAGQFAGSIVQSLVRIVSDGLVVFVILIYLALENLLALCVLLGLLTLVLVSYDYFFKNRIVEFGRQVNMYSTSLVKGVTEGIKGYRENHVFGVTNYFNKAVTESAQGLAHVRVKSQIIITSSRYFVELVLVTFIVLLVLVSVLFDENKENLIATLTMFAVASMRIIPSANQILMNVSKLRSGLHTLDVLYEDFKCLEKAGNLPGFNDFRRNEFEVPVDNNIKTEFSFLQLKDVSYQYAEDEEEVLKTINLRINNGDSIGVIGSSGSGKTTLIDVILGLLIPTQGVVCFNSESMTENFQQWHSQVAYLPQDVFLIDSTVANNIALGVETVNIDYNRVNIALSQARLLDTVEMMPDGVNTIIGEHGVRLSGGQRQRIALARAFYHDREVLVMDESTSALDVDTEREIVDEIRLLKGIKTLIVVAHRISTLSHCDVIYSLKDGTIEKVDYDAMKAS